MWGCTNERGDRRLDLGNSSAQHILGTTRRYSTWISTRGLVELFARTACLYRWGSRWSWWSITGLLGEMLQIQRKRIRTTGRTCLHVTHQVELLGAITSDQTDIWEIWVGLRDWNLYALCSARSYDGADFWELDMIMISFVQCCSKEFLAEWICKGMRARRGSGFKPRRVIETSIIHPSDVRLTRRTWVAHMRAFQNFCQNKYFSEVSERQVDTCKCHVHWGSYVHGSYPDSILRAPLSPSTSDNFHRILKSGL